jgi:hypothetical protein
MHKSVARTLLLIGFSTSYCLFKPSGSFATTPGIDSMKKNAIESFLKKANDPKTPLHQKLVELNQKDGRNPNGIFPKTLTTKDLQIVSIDGEDQFGSYCSQIEGKLERVKCTQEATETYLILISTKMGVRKATEYQPLIFVVKASKNIEWQRDEKDRESARRESIVIGEPRSISIDKLIPDR